MIREFAVPAPDARKMWLLLGPVLLAAVVGIGIAAREQPRAMFLFPLLLLPALLLVAKFRRSRVLLRDGELVVQAGLNSHRVPLDALDLEHARIVDLAERTELRPMLKTFGTSLPGYRSGHFRLRDLSRAFVLLTGARRVLVLPERSGRRLLLGVEKPQALLDALLAQRRQLPSV
ncbi:PH domain-containing protein [Lysobacter sp. Root494]|uniref:PH domain-containing protein n=1 Tax=Lysobacter sp. Root494 TaxID=1736549 RepID=UPI0006F66553|nr:PH domain-containing protein [Lysobacter sp. Root494]KQY51846.1 hypothetical protein ASD14_03985 [Lysobacter sp. Root494]